MAAPAIAGGAAAAGSVAACQAECASFADAPTFFVVLSAGALSLVIAGTVALLAACAVNALKGD